MSTPLRRLVGYAAFAAILAGAYFGGRHGWGPAERLFPVEAPPSSAKDTAAKLKAAHAARHTFTVDDALQLFLDATKPGQANPRIALLRALAQIRSGLAPSDVPELVAKLVELPDSGDRNNFIQNVLELLAGVDPKAALALGKKYPAAALSDLVMSVALTALAKKDPAQALQLLADFKPGTVNMGLYQSVFRSIGAANPQQAMDAASGLPDGPNRSAALSGALDGWSTVNTKGAFDWAAGQAATDPSYLGGLMRGAALRDPVVASNYVSLITNTAERTDDINTIAAMWAKGPAKDPSAALAWLQTVTDGSAYPTAVAAFFKSISQKTSNYSLDPSVLQSNPQLLSLTTPNLTPSEVAGLLTNVTGANARTGAIQALAGNWAQIDPNAALAWARTLSPDENATAISSIAPAIAANDPNAAFSLVEDLPDGPSKDKALNTTLGAMAKNDLAGTWKFALGLPDGSTRNAAISGIVQTYSHSDPARIAPLIAEMPPGLEQTRTTSAISVEWVQNDAITFVDWLDDQPDGPMRDAAIVQLSASSQIIKHPTMIFGHANQISDPELRRVQVQGVLSRWAARDPSGALQAAQKINLPDDQKAAIIQSLTK